MAEGETLIVGAGPTGLTLAIELARLGVPYRLIDRATEPARWSQALIVQARTLEQFDRYGIADAAVARGRPLHRITFHSNGKQIADFTFDRIRSRFAFLLSLGQNETERLLIDHLATLGGRVERGVALTGFIQDTDGVDAVLSGEGTPNATERFDWIVGCDGAHSTVRHTLGIDFEGDAVPIAFFLGDLELEGADVPGDELRLDVHDGDLVFIGRLTDRVRRVVVALHERQDENEPTLDDFQAAIDRCSGADMRVIGAEWKTNFTINERRVQHYRINRAFLAGDASHIHSPVAGQGMNTGIQDVANLAWKLAAVTTGANPRLLDSYDDERGEVGKALLANTSRGLAIATTESPLLAAVRDTVAPLASRLGFIEDRLAAFVSETAISYRDSAIVRESGGTSRLHAGDRALDVTLVGAGGRSRLLDRLQTPHHLILAIDVDDCSSFANRFANASFIALHTSIAIDASETAMLETPLDHDALVHTYGAGPAIYAIRPDGYIGYRGDPQALLALDDYARNVGLTRGTTISESV